MKNHSMFYKMPAKENLTGEDTTTLELCEKGLRTATTRSYPLGSVGEVITFENKKQQYKVTEVEKLDEIKINDPEWIKKWSNKEQWTEKHFHQVLGSKTVHIGSFQTSFIKI